MAATATVLWRNGEIVTGGTTGVTEVTGGAAGVTNVTGGAAGVTGATGGTAGVTGVTGCVWPDECITLGLVDLDL